MAAVISSALRKDSLDFRTDGNVRCKLAVSQDNTALFSGVNTDQCVLHSLTDANFLGYGCVLVEDCCATTSPDFCTEATVWNVKKCFGFVTDSTKILKALKRK